MGEGSARVNPELSCLLIAACSEQFVLSGWRRADQNQKREREDRA